MIADMKTKAEKSVKARKTSSNSMLIKCMVKHLELFGYRLEDMDAFTGFASFLHEDGTRMEFRNVREMIRFQREASHRKMY